MKDFKHKWKTLDEDRIMYLLKYGIVQEVMKIEERKMIRSNKGEAVGPAESSPKKVD